MPDKESNHGSTSGTSPDQIREPILKGIFSKPADAFRKLVPTISAIITIDKYK